LGARSVVSAKPCDADGAAECLRGVVEKGEAVAREEPPGVAHGERGPRRVRLVPSVLWQKVPGREAPGRMSAVARSRMCPPETLALATSVPVEFQLLSVADRRVGNRYCNGARPSPRPPRYLTHSHRPVRA
jgi:hypothetical protein